MAIFNLTLICLFKLILRRFEVVFWCLEWECCTFWKIDGNSFKSTNWLFIWGMASNHEPVGISKPCMSRGASTLGHQAWYWDSQGLIVWNIPWKSSQCILTHRVKELKWFSKLPNFPHRLTCRLTFVLISRASPSHLCWWARRTFGSFDVRAFFNCSPAAIRATWLLFASARISARLLRNRGWNRKKIKQEN